MPDSWVPVYSSVMPAVSETVTFNYSLTGPVNSYGLIDQGSPLTVINQSWSWNVGAGTTFQTVQETFATQWYPGGGGPTVYTTYTVPTVVGSQVSIGIPRFTEAFDRVSFTILGDFHVGAPSIFGLSNVSVVDAGAGVDWSCTDWTQGEAGFRGDKVPYDLTNFDDVSGTYSWLAMSGLQSGSEQVSAEGMGFVPGHSGGLAYTQFYNWVTNWQSAGGSTQLNGLCALLGGWGVPQVARDPRFTYQFPPSQYGTTQTQTYSWSRTTTVSALQFVVLLHFSQQTGGGKGWVGPHTPGDDYKDVAAVVWVGAASGSPATMPLYVGVNRLVQKNIGSGSGSTGGWDVHTVATVDARSDWGMAILPNGRMAVYYDTFDSNGNPMAQVVTADDWATGTPHWSGAQAASPNRSQVLSTGRMQQQSWRVEVTQ